MYKKLAIILGGVLFIGLAPSERTFDLAPGVYRVTLKALTGGQAGRHSSGLLHLNRSTCDDRSPETGQTIKNCRYLCLTPLYGWTDLDLSAVGAVVAGSGSAAPSPSSRDPFRPGVIELGDCTSETVASGHMLAIGTVLNRRDGRYGSDGPGILVRLVRAVGNCREGDWSVGGLGPDAGGSFRACQVDEAG